MPNPSVRSTSSATASALAGSGTFSVNAPAGMAAGDLLVAFQGETVGGGSPGAAPTGWSTLASVAFGVAASNLACFWKVATAGDVIAGSWLFNGASQISNDLVYIYAIQNAAATGPEADSTNFTATTGSAVTTGNITPLSNSELLLAAAAFLTSLATIGSQAFSDGTTKTDLGTLAVNNALKLDSWYGSQTTAATVGATATINASDPWGAMIVCIPPAPPSYDPSASNVWAGSEVVRRFAKPFRAADVDGREPFPYAGEQSYATDEFPHPDGFRLVRAIPPYRVFPPEAQLLLWNLAPGAYDPSQGTFDSYSAPIRVPLRFQPSDFGDPPPVIPVQGPPPSPPETGGGLVRVPTHFAGVARQSEVLADFAQPLPRHDQDIYRFAAARQRSSWQPDYAPPATTDLPSEYPRLDSPSILHVAARFRPVIETPPVLPIGFDLHLPPLDVQPGRVVAAPRGSIERGGAALLVETPADLLVPTDNPAIVRAPRRQLAGSDGPPLLSLPDFLTTALDVAAMPSPGTAPRPAPRQRQPEEPVPFLALQGAQPWEEPWKDSPAVRLPARPFVASHFGQGPPEAYTDIIDVGQFVHLGQQQPVQLHTPTRIRPPGEIVVPEIVFPVPVWDGSLNDNQVRQRVSAVRTPFGDPPSFADFIVAPVLTSMLTPADAFRVPAPSPRARPDANDAAFTPAQTAEHLQTAWDAQEQPIRRPAVLRANPPEDDTPAIVAAVNVVLAAAGNAWDQQTVRPRFLGPWRPGPVPEYPLVMIDTLTAPELAWGAQQFSRVPGPRQPFSPQEPGKVFVPALDLSALPEAAFTTRFAVNWRPAYTEDAYPPWRGIGSAPPGTTQGGSSGGGPVGTPGTGVIIVSGPYFVPAIGLYFAGAVEGDVQEG